jgi:AcrR family transcriptional regulator
MKTSVPIGNREGGAVGGARARRKAERPEQILEAAFEEFVLKGYSAARVEDIAARVGVTKGTVYFYFGSKEELFEKAIEVVGSAPLAKFRQNEAPWSDDIVQDLRTFLRDLYRFFGENPRWSEMFRLLLAEANRFPDLAERYFREWVDPVAERLRTRLGQAVIDRQIRAHPPHLAEVILSTPLAHHTMMLLFRKNKRILDPEQLCNAQIDLLLKGFFLGN